MSTRFRSKWLLATLAVAGLALLGAPRDAHAVLVLTGTITGTGIPGGQVTVFASDNNTLTGSAPAGAIILTDVNAASDSILLLPGVIAPGYSVSSSASFDTKTLGGNNLNSNALQIVNTTGSSVTTNIVVGDNNFVGPANQASASASGTFLNAAGSLYSVFFYNDPSNSQVLDVSAIPGTLILSNDMGPIGPGAFSTSYNSPSVAVVDPAAFGMSLNFQFTLVDQGIFVSRGQNELKTLGVPEPGTMAMVFTALPVLGGLGLRRLRRRPV